MKYLAIKEWDTYQHYKDRCPPWVKLHRSILTSATWVAVDDASRVLAIACMILASQSNNRIPADPEYLKRVAYLNKTPDWSKLVSVGFLKIIEENGDASMPNTDASAGQDHATIETEADQRQIRSEKSDPLFDEFWEAYPHKVGKGKARDAFAKAKTKTDPLSIIEALKAYPWPADEQFIPNPATWLNQERWLDKPVKRTHTPPARPLPPGTYVVPTVDAEANWKIRANTFATMIRNGQHLGLAGDDEDVRRLVREGYVTREECEAVQYSLWSSDPVMAAKIKSMLAPAHGAG